MLVNSGYRLCKNLLKMYQIVTSSKILVDVLLKRKKCIQIQILNTALRTYWNHIL